jgi:hypothetical protein
VAMHYTNVNKLCLYWNWNFKVDEGKWQYLVGCKGDDWTLDLLPARGPST